MQQETLEYEFRVKATPMLLAIAFFGACAAMMARTALTNDRGLILNGVITFEPGGATTFYWCVAAVALLFVAAGAYGLMAGRKPLLVRLTADEISAPRSVFAKVPTVVRLDDIRDVGVMDVSRQVLLIIHHTGGTLNIAQSMLASPAAFQELHRALMARLQARVVAAQALASAPGARSSARAG
ncbi:MAG TPA: hypothetical protein VFJ16_06725 [Longimicrobium sp.]|nr:hypothetical protein [Longimicrobium sp.]